MLMASPTIAPTGRDKQVSRIDPDPKFHSARRRQRCVEARNVRLPNDSRFHRGARAVEKRHDTVADDLENASIHLFDAVPDDLQAILKLAGCRDVVLLDQAGIAEHVGGQNRVHPARVASAKLRGVLVAAAGELDSKRNPVCDFDDVAIAQRARFSDRRPIDEGWIHRTEMGENQGFRPPCQFQMHSGYGRVANTNVAAGSAADRRFVLSQDSSAAARSKAWAPSEPRRLPAGEGSLSLSNWRLRSAENE